MRKLPKSCNSYALFTRLLLSLLVLHYNTYTSLRIIIIPASASSSLAFLHSSSKTNHPNDVRPFMIRRDAASNNNEDCFQPKFDGQLYYGLEADSQGYVTTTLSSFQNRNKDTTSRNHTHKERAMLFSCNTPIISRKIHIAEDIYVTVWEVEKPSTLIEHWIMSEENNDSDKCQDPFGVVMWPGSILAAREIINRRTSIQNATVLVLGAGLGVEVQTAIQMGAKHVIATDINPLTLQLLQHGISKQACYNNNLSSVELLTLDLCSKEEHLFPRLIMEKQVNVVVIADVLYNERLARCVGERCWDILSAGRPILLIVTDSQRFHGTDFLKELNLKSAKQLAWTEVMLQNITASGVLIDEDQTYDVKARMLVVEIDAENRI